jgi:antitoxin YefM
VKSLSKIPYNFIETSLMKVVNYLDFCDHLAESLNAVNEDRDILIVSRPNGNNVVVMDLEEYNSIQETLHLTGSLANHQRLTESIAEMNTGGGKTRKLLTK